MSYFFSWLFCGWVFCQCRSGCRQSFVNFYPTFSSVPLYTFFFVPSRNSLFNTSDEDTVRFSKVNTNVFGLGNRLFGFKLIRREQNCRWTLTQAKTDVKTGGAIHWTKIQTGPTEKRGPPQKVDPFFRNFSGWTEPIHWVLDRNFRKVWLNGSRPGSKLVCRPCDSWNFKKTSVREKSRGCYLPKGSVFLSFSELFDNISPVLKVKRLWVVEDGLI